MTKTTKKYFTVTEVGKILGLSKPEVVDLIEQGEIKDHDSSGFRYAISSRELKNYQARAEKAENIIGTAVISVYTRDDALADGVLIDVSEMAKEANFKIPVAITNAVYIGVVKPTQEAIEYGQDEKGRLWDVLFMAYMGARANQNTDRFLYSIIVADGAGKSRTVQLKSVVSPGDNWEPVLTIMFPDED
jgi:excisionase family DNA binding protein